MQRKNRLQTICSLIPKCGTVADIGCDHGKISEFIVKNERCGTLIVNDISAPSLEKAKSLLSAYAGGGVKTEFVCLDGAELNDYRIDCAVIAGMGGRTVLKILKSLMPAAAVLEPQNYAHGLRRGIWELGYGVCADTAVSDDGKYYDVLKIAQGKADLQPPGECAFWYGYGYKEKSGVLLEKLLSDRRKFLSFPQTPQNAERVRIIEEVLQWQQ